MQSDLLATKEMNLHSDTFIKIMSRMVKSIKRIAVTGGAGQIAYNLLFRIANGEIYGRDQAIALHILEVPQSADFLKGVVMELEDCCSDVLKEIRTGTDPMEVFEGINMALLVGAKPRSKGMERKDLLNDNAKIFVGQGKALHSVAEKDVKVLVVGNPCNTNCLIAMHHAPKIPKNQFFAMTRLDENRARFQIAKKAGVAIRDVCPMIVWGNHSSTQVPDFVNARIKGKTVPEVITDHQWLVGEFLTTIQKRGTEIIEARGKSSAASAANAIIETMRCILYPSEVPFSLALCSDENPYGVQKGLIFSFPCITMEGGIVDIVENLSIDDPFLEKKIAETEKELLEERDAVSHLL